MTKYYAIIKHAIPSLVAIALLEIVNVQVYIHGPISEGSLYILGWLCLQMIPGFVFGYISDRNFRKKALVISQFLGLVGGSILSVFGYENWVLVVIALTFNPLPVARAAFLDNFPQYSTLKLIAITFLAQHSPWVFFNFIAKFDYKVVVFWTLSILAINIILTIFFFTDNYDKKPKKHVSIFPKKFKIPLLQTLVAFTLAEATFYLLWAHLEVNPFLQTWQSYTTFGTVLGILIALLYNRLPHISIITLFYTIGAGILITVFVGCIFNLSKCNDYFVYAMSHYAVIGGIYLPFVTAAVIDMFGSRNKAFGSATIEFGDTIASFIAPITGFFLKDKIQWIILVTVFLYVLASFIQRSAEKRLISLNYGSKK